MCALLVATEKGTKTRYLEDIFIVLEYLFLYELHKYTREFGLNLENSVEPWRKRKQARSKANGIKLDPEDYIYI